VSEWLDLMLDEISRKKRESREARDELERRNEAAKEKAATPATPQSK
jgi:hypothetical protein